MSRKVTLEEVLQIALARGGQCLATEYVRGTEPLEWQCAERHRWHATPNAVKTRTWCPVCALARKRDNLATMQRVAAERGGQCLSDVYVDGATPLEWQCDRGHRWKAKATLVKRGSWCPECARLARLGHTIGEMHELARTRGGQCLSDTYVNGQAALQWRCANGHEWSASATRILQGSWCRQCYFDSMRGTLADMQALAASRGGRCLSGRYVNAWTHLLWQCSRGHEWKAVPYSIRVSWCPQCAILDRITASNRSKRKQYVTTGKLVGL
ncbi:hypothetical protein [Paraburkholderia adhaesiva]|uniref:hypothetical protein n=1 Tax=Paraburkholderia adhaesiva TaxID=2883244 RepID=UPI001F2565F5|nr:hypothetical protein [Paraburkholderia adhaesiva]